MRQVMDPSETCNLTFILQIFSPANVIFAGIGILLSVCILVGFVWAYVTPKSLRRLRMFEQAKTHLSTFLNALKCFSDVLMSIQNCRRLLGG